MSYVFSHISTTLLGEKIRSILAKTIIILLYVVLRYKNQALKNKMSSYLEAKIHDYLRKHLSSRADKSLLNNVYF